MWVWVMVDDEIKGVDKVYFIVKEFGLGSVWLLFVVIYVD